MFLRHKISTNSAQKLLSTMPSNEIPPDAEPIAFFPAWDPFVKELLGDQYENFVLPQAKDFYDAVHDFVSAIDWQEPWLIALLSFHVLTFLILIVTRKHHNFQIGMFLFLVVMAFLGETINELGRQHWKLFSETNYFDEPGFFVTMVYGLPIIINSVLALLFMMLRTVDMLVFVKRAQLKEQRRKETSTASQLSSKPSKNKSQSANASAETKEKLS